MRVALIGHSTAEAVPLFHFSPGDSVIRLLLRSARSMDCVEEAAFEICEWASGERLPEVEVEDEVIANLISSWGVSAVVLDGIEPAESVSPLRLSRALSIEVVVRSHGLAEPEASYVLLEDISAITGKPELRRSFFKSAERLAARARLELAVYLLKPSEEALEHAELSASIGAPLHVIVQDHGGGGPAKRLYEMIRKRAPFAYLHADTYSELDTRCPSCGSLLMRRDGRSLLWSQLKDGACPRCAARIPIAGRAAERTSPSLMRLLKEGTAWYSPQLYAGLLAYKGRGRDI